MHIEFITRTVYTSILDLNLSYLLDLNPYKGHQLIRMLMERDDAREQLLVRQREAAISLCFTVESLLALGPKFTIVSCNIALNQTNPLSVWDVFFNHRCQNHSVS